MEGPEVSLIPSRPPPPSPPLGVAFSHLLFSLKFPSLLHGPFSTGQGSLLWFCFLPLHRSPSRTQNWSLLSLGHKDHYFSTDRVAEQSCLIHRHQIWILPGLKDLIAWGTHTGMEFNSDCTGFMCCSSGGLIRICVTGC